MSRHDIAADILYPDGPEDPEDDDRRLQWCRRGQHSYFGPICMTCGHDRMRRMNGDACGCEVCRTQPGDYDE